MALVGTSNWMTSCRPLTLHLAPSAYGEVVRDELDQKIQSANNSFIVELHILAICSLTKWRYVVATSNVPNGHYILSATKLQYLVYLAFGSGVVTDVLIAATICYYLNKHRTGFSS